MTLTRATQKERAEVNDHFCSVIRQIKTLRSLSMFQRTMQASKRGHQFKYLINLRAELLSKVLSDRASSNLSNACGTPGSTRSSFVISKHNSLHPRSLKLRIKRINQWLHWPWERPRSQRLLWPPTPPLPDAPSHSLQLTHSPSRASTASTRIATSLCLNWNRPT